MWRYAIVWVFFLAAACDRSWAVLGGPGRSWAVLGMNGLLDTQALVD